MAVHHVGNGGHHTIIWKAVAYGCQYWLSRGEGGCAVGVGGGGQVDMSCPGGVPAMGGREGITPPAGRCQR